MHYKQNKNIENTLQSIAHDCKYIAKTLRSIAKTLQKHCKYIANTLQIHLLHLVFYTNFCNVFGCIFL